MKMMTMRTVMMVLMSSSLVSAVKGADPWFRLLGEVKGPWPHRPMPQISKDAPPHRPINYLPDYYYTYGDSQDIHRRDRPLIPVRRTVNEALLRDASPIMERATSPSCAATPTAGSYSIGQVIILKSPNFPNLYPKNEDCSWKLTSLDANARFKIKCKVFRLQREKDNTCFDYLQYDGLFFCGKEIPSNWISAFNHVTIRFVSNSDMERDRGFKCKAIVINVNKIDFTKCLGNPIVLNVREGESMVIKSPNFPGKYRSKQFCGWYIQGADWSVRLNITCSTFSIWKSKRGHCRDWFSIDGNRFCGKDGPPSGIIPGGNFFKFWFSSIPRSKKHRGFKCIITGVGAGSYGVGASTGCKCGRVGPDARVVGGVDAGLNQFPYHVSLQYLGFHFCGGSIINDRWILTAAHCLGFGLPTFHVNIGAHTLSAPPPTSQLLDAEIYYVHYLYNPDTLENDTGFVKVLQTIDFSDPKIAPICPPDITANYYGVDITVAGWGYTMNDSTVEADTLQKVDQITITNQDCNAIYNPHSIYIYDSMICGDFPDGGKGPCQGDSGGAAITAEGDHYVQIAIVSWIVRCGWKGIPSGYATVANQMLDINFLTSEGETCPK